MKQKFVEDEQRRETIFLQKITEKEEQEKDSLRLAHEAQSERAKIAAEDSIQALINLHNQKELAHEESERQRLQGTENKYWTGVYDTLLNHQENYTKILEKHHKEQLELLVQIHQEERLTFETERNEIEELCRDQNRSDMEKEDFLAIITEIEQQVLQNHTAQIKEFKSVQNEDLIDLKREQKIYRQEVKKTAPDTILYVYAKTKKEKGRKKEKKSNSNQN